jgi:hypothetical protein
MQQLTETAQLALCQQLGRTTLAPLLGSFVWWLHEQAKHDGITRLLFLARDGYMVQQAYRAIIPPDEQLPNQYMYASRRLFNFAAIRRLDKTALHFLIGDNVDMPVGHYLGRIGLEPALYLTHIKKAGFSNGPETPVTSQNRDCLQALFMNLEEPIIKAAAAERVRLKAYAGQMITPNEITAVVDIGWHGSLQTSLADVLGTEPKNVRGYYLGLHFGAHRQDGSTMKAFLDESRLGDLWLYRKTLRQCVELFELFFASTEGSVIGLRRDSSGAFEAAREPQSLPPHVREHIIALQDAALIALRQNPRPLKKQQALRPVARLLLWPTAAEAQTLGDIPHQEGFGGYGRFQQLARVPRGIVFYARHPGRFWHDWRTAFWRRGFLVRLFRRV